MKTNVITESGVIDAKGNLRLPMDRVNAYFAEHKGERVIVRFESVPVGSTMAQISYYYGYVLPELVQAYKKQGTRITADSIDRKLVQLFPGEKETGLGKNVVYARDLSKTQMFDFMDWLKQFAAENLFVYVEDPKTI